MTENNLIAGASAVDITPQYSLHLAGYPFVKRDSTGVHDRLLSSALYLKKENDNVLFIGNDVIFIPKDLSLRARNRINAQTGISQKCIIISASHTHSSPSTIEFVSGSHDKLLPPVDKNFLQQLEDGIVAAGIKAFDSASEAKLDFSIADATGIGTNRHNPEGLCDMQVPVLVAKHILTNEPVACMIVCNMHPTVLHDDSTLVSGDFPGLARLHLQKNIFQKDCPVIYHMGTAGNQSPRHVTREKTFSEAERIAGILSGAIEKSFKDAEELKNVQISVQQLFVELPRKKIPAPQQALENEKVFANKLKELKAANASLQAIRSAEVNWFGAAELVNLAQMNASDTLKFAYDLCMPAEIQVVKIGKLNFVAWPGEIFVEYGLKIKEKIDNTFVITLSNGDLQVYIATKDAVDAGVYEANNAIFDYTSGDKLVQETLSMLNDQ